MICLPYFRDSLEMFLHRVHSDESRLPGIRNIAYIAHHKYTVGRAILWIGLPWWRAVLHDVQKLSRKEFQPYALTFFSGKSPRNEDGTYDPEMVSAMFAAAWHHHIGSGELLSGHHWDYWCRVDQAGKPMKIQDMPDTYQWEMIADWIGAGRSIVGEWNPLPWYRSKRGEMVMSEKTRVGVESKLAKVAKKMEGELSFGALNRPHGNHGLE